MQRDRDHIRAGLANAIADVHPDRIGDIGDDSLDDTSRFLRTFNEVYTTNYDLLLYWSINRDGGRDFDDGFRRRDGVLVHAEPERQNVFWLHGGLHLYEDLGAPDDLARKVEWTTGTPLVDQIRATILDGALPLMVMEGTWKQKQRRVSQSSYLTHAQRSLRAATGSLVTYGWAINDNDRHIAAAIQRSEIAQLFVGIHGDTRSAPNARTIGAATQLAAESGSGLTVRYWSTTTARLWV